MLIRYIKAYKNSAAARRCAEFVPGVTRLPPRTHQPLSYRPLAHSLSDIHGLRQVSRRCPATA